MDECYFTPELAMIHGIHGRDSLTIDGEQVTHLSQLSVSYPVGHVDRHIIYSTGEPVPWFHYSKDVEKLLLFLSKPELRIWNAGQ